MSKKRNRRHASTNGALTLPQARKQTQRHPTDPDAWLTLGRLQANQKAFDDAKASLEKAQTLRPSHHEQEEWLGHVAHKQHRLQDALHHLQQAQTLAPESIFGLVTLAHLHLELGGSQKALEYAQKAWQSDSQNTRVMDVLANCLSALYRYDESIDIYDHLIRLTPDSFVPWNSAGNMRRELGLLDEAYHCYRKANELAPHNAIAYSNHLTALHYDPRATRAEIAAFAKSWEKRFAPNAAKLAPPPKRPQQSCQQHLTVGLLSDGLRNHPVGKMIVRCLENLPTGQMTLVAYTTSEVSDSFTRRIKAKTKEWRSIRHLSDDDLTQQIHYDEIDILIDLSGHNAGTRMRAIAKKPAPLIVKWVGGLINTTGVQAIDYLISDHVETPEGEDEYYTEKLIRLPDDYIVFDPPEKLPEISPLPAKKNGYITLACFNNPTKLNDVALKQWAGIMHELPDSRLMLKGRPYTSESFCERLYTTLEAEGIARERLIIEGPGNNYEMLDAYNRADIALDPWPYSGGLTTCESFIMGVPVVTLPGPTFAGRHSATHLVHAGMPELVVNSWEDYRARVIELASDLESLGTIRQHLRDVLLQSPVCDGSRFAKHFTDAMRAIWQRYCDDKASAALTFNKEGEARFEDEDAPVEIHYAEASEDDSTFQWQFDGKLIAVDNGGQLLESDVVRQLLQKEALELIAFDPSSQALDTSLKQHEGVHYYPNATLGDGQPGQLHACLDPKLSASLAPLDDEYQPEAIRKGSQVLTRLPLNTIALDSIQGLPAIDWLVLDGLNDASAILDNGTRALKDTLLLQVKVAFQPTHERQPNLAEIQHWASRNGFRFYRLHEPQHRSHLPEDVPKAQRQATELVSAYALLLPNTERMAALSDKQRMKLAFVLSTGLGAHDIAYKLISGMDKSGGLEFLESTGFITKRSKYTAPPISYRDEHLIPTDNSSTELISSASKLNDLSITKKERVVHICFNNMHTQSLVDSLSKLNEKTSVTHVVLISREKSIAEYNVNIKKNKMAFFFNSNKDISKVANECLKDNIKGVIFHGLFFGWQKEVLKSIGKAKKVLWVMWGGDLYNPIKQKDSLKDTLPFIDAVATVTDSDYNLFEEWYEYRPHFKFRYAPKFEDAKTSNYKKEKMIVVGNSGDPSNCHLEILNSLESKKDINNYRIIIPFSYNVDKKYYDRLLTCIKSLSFKKSITFLTQFLSNDEYFDLISRAEMVITAHHRSQAGATINAAFFFGAEVVLRQKIYVDEKWLDNPHWLRIKEMGIRPMDFNSFHAHEAISSCLVKKDEEKSKDRQAIMEHRGSSAAIKQMDKTINDFLQLNSLKGGTDE